MYPLIKRLNIDVLKQIHEYNNYTKLELEFYEYLHKERFRTVLNDMRCLFYFVEHVLNYEDAPLV